MPKITDPRIVEILLNSYFDQHTAMHLARERFTLPDGTKLSMILPPCQCDDCSDTDKPGAADMPAGMAGMSAPPATTGDSGMADMSTMIEAGEPGSGRQLLDMHHEMIRVFRFLLETHKPPLRFLPYWPTDPFDPIRQWSHRSAADVGNDVPEVWDLDDSRKLPHEIVGMLKVTDPRYLDLVFAGVKRLVEPNEKRLGDAVDDLGLFIERGVETGEPDGSGFHDTMHEYLASREGKAAQGAEMNKLGASRFNDYFWSIHLWIDAQYGRLLEKRGVKFDTSPLDPATLDMCTKDPASISAPGKAPEMSMA